jgi:hypothetical protein
MTDRGAESGGSERQRRAAKHHYPKRLDERLVEAFLHISTLSLTQLS